MSRLIRSLWLLSATALPIAALVTLWWSTQAATALPAGSRTIVIDSVLYDGYELDDLDEAVRLYNAGDQTVDLSGWQLGDGGATRAIVPGGRQLAPGEAIWLARDAAAFRRQFGHAADAQPERWPGFANDGDEVLLYDAVGSLVDALVYEGGDAGSTGWIGEAVQPYTVVGVFGAEGQILFRRRDPASGKPAPDSDRASDWAQTRVDVINGRKVRYPGWDADAFFATRRLTETARLTISVAPDNSFSALLNAIERAEKSIELATLTIENIKLGQALADAAGRGVRVTLLLEGAPVGGLSDAEKYVCRRIESAGGACWFMIADAGQRIADRYRYMHAKYLIIDNAIGVIGSENFSPDSFPDDDKADGTWGRRGLLLLTDAPGVAAYLQALFARDLDPAHPDLLRWQVDHPLYGAPPPGYLPPTESGGITYTVRYPYPLVIQGRFPFELILSPENSLRASDGLLGLVGRAGEGDTVLAQQLNERPYWGPAAASPLSDPNPRLEAYIAAARRGAKVRLLLDAYFDDPESPLSNAATCAYLDNLARQEPINVACVQANPTGLGIHNKMVLVEVNGQGYVHLGSLNGTELSAKGNRELAVQIQSNTAYAYLADLFVRDFPHVAYLPLQAGNTQGAALHLLISEVMYDPPGLDEAEFIEIANPTGETIDLGEYSLGDAVNPTDFEDVRRFPAGAVLPRGETVVAAMTAAGFRVVFGANPDFEIVNSDPAVPDMADDPNWGDPEALLQLGNAGDEVILRRGAIPVDVVSYGAGSYPGEPSCPLLSPPNRTLERLPWWGDTNNCPADFRAWPFPSPGRLP